MEPITLDHIKQAAVWAAQTKTESKPIGSLERSYKQSEWECGTSCCMWGAASILAGCGPAAAGPSPEWSGQDLWHTLVAGILRSGNSTPEQMLQLLRNADLRAADLRGVNLSGADLRGVNLRNADLRGVDLRGVNLSDADLRGVNLRGADLRGVNLSDADLRGADLHGVDLSGADLRDADLRGADLRGVNLSDADLRGADLRGAEIKIGNTRHTIAK